MDIMATVTTHYHLLINCQPYNKGKSGVEKCTEVLVHMVHCD